MARVSFSHRESLHFSYDPLKARRRAHLRVAVVYPSSYAVGMDNLGFQGVLRLFASYPGVHCERAFYDKNSAGFTFESRLPLRSFDIIAFSISFENDYLNVIRILKDSAIEPLASRRAETSPFLLAGGVGAFINPEPITPFMDAIFLGEADEAIQEILRSYIQHRKKGKQSVMESMALIEGMYVPSIHSPFLRKGTPPAGTKRVQRRTVSELSSTFCSTGISSPHSHFGGMFLMEVARGCSRRCRFCAATSVYAPLRFVSSQSLLALLERDAAGVKTVGLVGACVSDYPHLTELIRALVASGTRVSLSSLRADIATTGILEIIARSGTRTVTIAPEAGTPRLRGVIRKELEEASLMETVSAVKESGIVSLKLYFMVGLPGEQPEDLEAITSLVAAVRSRFVGGKRARFVTVSVSPFVPKACTPFQWCSMDERRILRTKMQGLAKGLSRLKGVRFRPQSLRGSILQGALSRGSWRTGLALHRVVFEGLGAKSAWHEAGLAFGAEVSEERDRKTLLPWEHLNVGPPREELLEEFEKAFGKD